MLGFAADLSFPVAILLTIATKPAVVPSINIKKEPLRRQADFTILHIFPNRGSRRWRL